jgi:mannitol-1-/sugar-/sorbitol-6-phosphatase
VNDARKSLPTDVRPVRVIAIAGVAGSGKTTLGRAVAAALRLPILDLDSLTNPLLDGLAAHLPGPHWLSGPAAADIRSARYAALRSAAADIVSVGSGVVLVAPFTAELRGADEWRALVDAVAPADLRLVRVDGSPELLARRRGIRAEGRDGFRPPDDRTPPSVPHIAVDAALATDQQLHRVLRDLGRRTPIDAASPVFGVEFDAALFDVDGTILDSTSAVLRSWGVLADEYGFDPAAVQQNHGRSARALLERLLTEDLVEAANARILALETAEVAGILAIPGAAALLDALPSGGKALVTSAPRVIATARLAAAGLIAPAVFITLDDVDRPKPDPQPFLRAAARLGVDPSRCVVFEDAPAGVVAARAAGCRVIGVAGTGDPDELGADLVVDGLDRLRVVRRGASFTLEPVS